MGQRSRRRSSLFSDCSVVALLASRQDRWGLAAALLMIAVGGVMVVGSLGEALAASTSDVPRVVQIGGGIVDVTASVMLVLLAIWDTSRRLRQSAVQPASQS